MDPEDPEQHWLYEKARALGTFALHEFIIFLRWLRWLREHRVRYVGTPAEPQWRAVASAVGAMSRAFSAGGNVERWRRIIETNAVLAREALRAHQLRERRIAAGEKLGLKRLAQQEERRREVQRLLQKLWHSEPELRGNAAASVRRLDELDWLRGEEITVKLSTIETDVRAIIKKIQMS